MILFRDYLSGCAKEFGEDLPLLHDVQITG